MAVTIEGDVDYPVMVITEEQRPQVLDHLHGCVHYIYAPEEVRERVDQLPVEDLIQVLAGFRGSECLDINIRRTLGKEENPNHCVCDLCQASVPEIRNYR